MFGRVGKSVYFFAGALVGLATSYFYFNNIKKSLAEKKDRFKKKFTHFELPTTTSVEHAFDIKPQVNTKPWLVSTEIQPYVYGITIYFDEKKVPRDDLVGIILNIGEGDRLNTKINYQKHSITIINALTESELFISQYNNALSFGILSPKQMKYLLSLCDSIKYIAPASCAEMIFFSSEDEVQKNPEAKKLAEELNTNDINSSTQLYRAALRIPTNEGLYYSCTSEREHKEDFSRMTADLGAFSIKQTPFEREALTKTVVSISDLTAFAKLTEQRNNEKPKNVSPKPERWKFK